MLTQSPRFNDKPFLVRYAAGTILVVIATLLTSGLWLIVDRPISAPLFLAAIVLSTWLFGMRVGVYVSLISGLSIDYYFIPPYFSFPFTQNDLLRLCFFLIEGSALGWITDKLRIASDEIRSSREELRELTEHQRTLRETEQKRIALEIHDELGQALTGLKMDVHFLKNRMQSSDPSTANAEAIGDLTKLSSSIDDTINSVRRIASELRPSILDDFGLVAASEWQVQQFEQTTQIKCRFATDCDDLDLGSESNTVVFRILQEALTNVARHAEATSVFVNLRKNTEHVIMTIVDDGKGIEPEGRERRRGLGIVGMRERSLLIGGELDISNAYAGGTIVELRIPA